MLSMKLFDGFEAIVFPQENKILITHHGYLYYIYDRENTIMPEMITLPFPITPM